MYHANVNVNLTNKNVIKIKSGLMINVDVTVKKHHICEKDYIRNPDFVWWNYKKYSNKF